VLNFLIDECLSLDLVEVARDRGFSESSHVAWLGKAGWKDWALKTFILEGDWTFVTRNSIDFRGLAESIRRRGPSRGSGLYQWAGRNDCRSLHFGPNEQKIKPIESISIFSVHFTLNLPRQVVCSG
jgi:hypothetical protein